jgi:hypothetical protein
MKYALILGVLFGSAAYAGEVSNACIGNAKGVAIAFAQNRNNGHVGCEIIAEPQFSFSREPGAGIVTVGLACDQAIRYQVTMTWTNDSDGSCRLSDKRISDDQ